MNKMKEWLNRALFALLVFFGFASSAQAQNTIDTAVELVEDSSATATTIFIAFAVMSATAFVLSVVMRFARKGIK